MKAAPVTVEFWDWNLANWIAGLGLLVTTAGFALAIVQLWRAASATVQTRKLLAQLRVRVIANDLLVALPRLQDLEDAVDASVKSGVAAEVEKSFLNYSRGAAELIGLLEADDEFASDPLLPALRQAESAARKAKSDLATGTTKPLLTVAGTPIRRIGQVSTLATGLRGRIQRKVTT